MGVSFVSHKDEILEELKRKIAEALEVCGGVAESYAKELCPVDTGRLRNSITHAQTGEQEESIGSNVEYAPYVELGTRKMMAQPFLQPAAENHSQQYNDIIKRTLQGE